MKNKAATGKNPFLKRKPVRIAGLGLAGLGLLALVLPAVMGIVINSRLEALQTAFLEQGLPVTDMRLQQGWFTSGLEVDFDPPKLFARAADTHESRSWTVHLTVHHGPLLQRFDRPSLGVARLAGTLHFPPGGFAGGRPPIEAQVHLFADFGNEQWISLIVPSRFEELATNDQDITIDWAGLRADTQLATGEIISDDLLAPGLEVRIHDKADEDFLLAGVEGLRLNRQDSLETIEDEEGALLADTRMEASEIYYDLFVQGNRRALSLENLLIYTENTPDADSGGLFHQRGRSSLGVFHLIQNETQIPAHDIILRHRIDNLRSTTLRALSAFFDISRFLPGPAGAAQGQDQGPDMHTLLQRLSEDGTTLSILGLEGETPVGGFSAWLDLAVNAHAAGQATGLPALLNALTGEGELILEERLARAMARVSLRRQLGEVTDTLAPEALDTFADALLAEQAGTYGLRRTDGQYELQFEVTGGYLFVGGQPVYSLSGLLD